MSRRTDAENQNEKPENNEEIRNKYLEKVKNFDLEKLKKQWREARLKHLESIRNSNCASNDNNNSILQGKTKKKEYVLQEQQKVNVTKRLLKLREEYIKSFKTELEKQETLKKSNERDSQIDLHDDFLKLSTKTIKGKDNSEETLQISSEQKSQLELHKRNEEYVGNEHIEKLRARWRVARPENVKKIRKSKSASNDNNNFILQGKPETKEYVFQEQQDVNVTKRLLKLREEYIKSFKTGVEKQETLKKSNERDSQIDLHDEFLKLSAKTIKRMYNLEETLKIPNEQKSQLELRKRNEEYVGNEHIEKLRARWRVARPENVEKIRKSKSASNDNNNSILQNRAEAKECVFQEQQDVNVTKRLLKLREEYIKSLKATAEKRKKLKKSNERNSQFDFHDEFLKLSAKTIKEKDNSEETLQISSEQYSQLELLKRKKEYVGNEPIEKLQARWRETRLKHLENTRKSKSASKDNNNSILQEETETKEDEFNMEKQVKDLKRLLNLRNEYLKSLKAKAKKKALKKLKERKSQLKLHKEFLKLSAKTIKRKDNSEETLQILNAQNSQLDLRKRNKEYVRNEHIDNLRVRSREVRPENVEKIRESMSASNDNNNSGLQDKTETKEDEFKEQQNVNDIQILFNLFDEYLKAVKATAEKEEMLEKSNERNCQLNLHNEFYELSAITVTGKDSLKETLQIQSEQNSILEGRKRNEEYLGNEPMDKLQARCIEASNDENKSILQYLTETKEDEFEEQQEINEEKRKLILRDKYLRAIKARAEREKTLKKSDNTTEDDNLEAKLRLLSGQYFQLQQRLDYLEFQVDNGSEKLNDKENVHNELISQLKLRNECLQLVNDFVGKKIGNIEEYIIESNKLSTDP